MIERVWYREYIEKDIEKRERERDREREREREEATTAVLVKAETS